MDELTREEFDRRLAHDTERLQAETAELRERRVRLELLLARKQALIQRLSLVWEEVQVERLRIQAEEKALLPAGK